MLTLNLAIATHKPEGIERVAAMNLPPMDGVRYVVSWQAHADYPIPHTLMQRDDIEIHRFDAVGQSLNRNNAIDHCTADIILHADDDVIYTLEGLRAVIKAFEDNPQMDVAAFKVKLPHAKNYPDIIVNLNTLWPKNYHTGMVELAFRRETAGFMRCCPELGLASPRLHGGEDEMFLFSAIKRGLNCYFIPEQIGTHPNETTGSRKLSDATLRAAGCIIAFMRPATAFLRVPLKAWRVSRAGQAPFFRALYYITAGAVSAPAVRRRNHDTLW